MTEYVLKIRHPHGKETLVPRRFGTADEARKVARRHAYVIGGARGLRGSYEKGWRFFILPADGDAKRGDECCNYCP